MPPRRRCFGNRRGHARSIPRAGSHHTPANRGGRHFAPKQDRSYRYDAKSSRFKGNYATSIQLRQLFAPSVVGSIRNFVRNRTRRKTATPEPGSPIPATTHKHQLQFESFTFRSDKPFSRDHFGRFADALSSSIIRAKGFVCFVDGAELSTSWPAAGSWNRLKQRTQSWSLSGRTFCRKRKRLLNPWRNVSNNSAESTELPQSDDDGL